VANSSVGNTLNSSGERTCIAVSSTITATPRLPANRRSIIGVGNGIKMTSKQAIKPIGNNHGFTV
jgi:hypothetical protein